ncbi:MAG: neutral/alkaline non-lysosomal ceramidase N-terminal domain-containing protein [Planctomycetaceae bacterium]
MKLHSLVLSLAVAFAPIVGGAFAAETGPLQAGAATANITPNLGGEIIGGFKPFPSTYIHDELHARCLVLDNGKTRVAIVICDLLGIHRSVSDEARRLIQEEAGIPLENVLISGTHTHSAVSALGERFQERQELNDYQKFVARRIADGVRCAAAVLRPAEIAFGTAEAPEHVNNRRWFMRPGTIPPNPFGGVDLVRMNPPAGSENLTEPAGPTDPVVSFLSVREPGGKPIAVYAAYSLHYVGGVGNGHVSADYYGMFCEELARLQNAVANDPPFVAMLANGTSGDVNNIDFVKPRGRKEPYEQMRYVAHDVAGKVNAALANLAYKKEIVLGAKYRELDVATRRPSEELLIWAEKTLASAPEDRNTWELPHFYAERTKNILNYPETLAIPLQVLRVDNVSIGTMPTETFCEIGMEYRDRSPLKPAFMVSLAHGYYGYLPTPRHHDLGGYETWLGTNRLEREASVKMLDALIEMTQQLAE